MVEILVVDDEPDVLYLIKRILERNGFSVIGAEDGESCLEMLKTERPDLIILDVMMPGLNGWQVSDKIKTDENLRDIPVIILTVRSEDADMQKSINSKADAHLNKPINQSNLIETIKKLLKDKGQN